VFKPAFDNFRTAFRDHPPDFRDLMRFEPAIEDHREIVQPQRATAAAILFSAPSVRHLCRNRSAEKFQAPSGAAYSVRPPADVAPDGA